MFSPFFHLAAVSPSRQRSFRSMVVFHIAVVSGGLFFGTVSDQSAVIIGQVLLVTGIIEGALLVGWRLAQMPKSQALEFLLVSPISPPAVLLAEASVGLAIFALVTLSGLPLLLLMTTFGIVLIEDVPWLLLLPLTWGAVTGLGLTTWAYEGATVRRWGERVMIAGIIFYLLVGVLAGENIITWLAWLPRDVGNWGLSLFRSFHNYNPFGVMKFAMENSPAQAWDREVFVTLLGLSAFAVCLVRSAYRLKGHFHDRHYRPVLLDKNRQRTAPGDQPLSWWAVKRVTEYSGRINLWLAGGFAVMYAIYIVAQADWPSWMGKQAFEIFDRMGGVPVLATALILLAAVPAAFQYGLWDSNVQDRCRRLELLLLTQLDGFSYWRASTAAAWRRGRGYLAIAALLWGAGLWAGRVSPEQVVASAAAAMILWSLYFALGFWAFMRGHQANSLGLTLTLGLPLAAFLLFQAHWPEFAAMTPPGSVYQAAAHGLSWAGLAGLFAAGLFTLAVGRWSLANCDRKLRGWYDRNHGLKAAV